jgi:hypothetical protein
MQMLFAVRQRRRWCKLGDSCRAPTCTQVREVVVGLGAPAVPALIQALGDSDVLFALRQRRRWANSATPKPCPRSSKHWGIASSGFAVRQRRRWANSATPKPCPALSVWAHAGEDAARDALQTLGHPMLDLPQAVAQVAAQGAWGVLIRALTCTQVREVVVGLGAPAVPALIQALGDSGWDVRRAAAEALGAIGDPQAVPALIQALGDSGEMFAVRHDKPFSKSKRSSLKQNDLSFSGGCPMKHEDALPIEEWVRAARVHAAECVGWFAPALYAAPLHLSDALPAPAAIDRYGRVYFNPQWVARLYEACGHDRHALVRQLAQVWYHEVAHWLREHEARAQALHADARLWNLAADMEINDYLPDEMAYPSLGGEPLAVLPRRYNLPDGEIAEWYYQRLVERAREQAQAGGQQQQAQAGRAAAAVAGRRAATVAGGQQRSQQAGSSSRRRRAAARPPAGPL